MNDIWVCDSCKSINRQRDDKCYHCRASRSGAMVTPGLNLRAENAAAERSVSAYVISWPLALVTSALLVAVAILGLVILKVTAASFASTAVRRPRAAQTSPQRCSSGCCPCCRGASCCSRC